MSMRVVGALLLIMNAAALSAAPVYAPVSVKRLVLQEGAARVILEEGIDYPSSASDQDRSSRPWRVITNPVQHPDPQPPPCEPSASNFWCFGSSTSSCKANRTCEEAEGVCLETTAQENCYKWVDSAGHDQCDSCVIR